MNSKIRFTNFPPQSLEALRIIMIDADYIYNIQIKVKQLLIIIKILVDNQRAKSDSRICYGKAV